MFPNTYSHLSRAASVALMLFCIKPALQAASLKHDFDTHFSPGRSVSGQPSVGTHWSGPSTWLRVEKSAGREGAGLSTPEAFPGAFATQVLSPSAADLGGNANATGTVLVQLDLRMDDTPAVSATNNALVLRIGKQDSATCAVRINIKDTGALRPLEANKEVPGRHRLEPGVWAHLRILINFDEGYATLTVDEGEPVSLNLDKSRPQERFGQIEILTGNSEAAYRRFSLDNLVCSRP